MRKLTLKRHTLRSLDPEQMQTIQAGTATATYPRRETQLCSGPIIPASQICPTNGDGLTSVVRPGGWG